MSEQNQEERTEQASAKRLREAREKGDIPRSRDLSAATVTLAVVVTLLATHKTLATRMTDLLSHGLQFSRAELFDPAALTRVLGTMAMKALILLVPIFFVAAVAALLAPLVLGGWTFSTQALSMQFSRLDPLQGLQRLFSSRGVVELAKALAKILVIGVVTALLLWHFSPQWLANGIETGSHGIVSALDLVGWSALALAGSLGLISLVDVPWQLFDYARRHRMTREELRQEYKETEGRPEVKGRIRNLQQQMARRRMMEQVPKANVVITNPTHYAVALRYDEAKMRAPVLVAKGTDLVAIQIRTLAQQHRIPLVAAPPLARALYRSTQLGTEIPSVLYVAVAQILAYIYRLKRALEFGEAMPEFPSPEVDPTLLKSPEDDA